MSLWDSLRDSVKDVAQKAGNAASIAATKTKLKTEIMMTDRAVRLRQEKFGVELYDHVESRTSQPEFFASDDKLTSTIRPPLLVAQREIAALSIRKRKLKEEIAQAEVTRKSAFPTPASTFGGKVMNAGKSASLAGNEAKLSTELSVVETQIKGHKQSFGVEMYAVFVRMEDTEEWLPTDRDIRAMYDQCRRDIDNLEKKRQEKEKELKNLGTSSYMPETSVVNATNSYGSPAPTVPSTSSAPPTNSYGASTSAVSSSSAKPVPGTSPTPVMVPAVPVGFPSSSSNGVTHVAQAFPAPSSNPVPVGFPSGSANATQDFPTPDPFAAAPAINPMFLTPQTAAAPATNDPFAGLGAFTSNASSTNQAQSYSQNQSASSDPFSVFD